MKSKFTKWTSKQNMFTSEKLFACYLLDIFTNHFMGIYNFAES